MLLQELTGGQGKEAEGQRLALPGLDEDDEDDEDLEHAVDAVLQGDAVMGKYTKVSPGPDSRIPGEAQAFLRVLEEQVIERWLLASLDYWMCPSLYCPLYEMAPRPGLQMSAWACRMEGTLK